MALTMRMTAAVTTALTALVLVTGTRARTVRERLHRGGRDAGVNGIELIIILGGILIVAALVAAFLFARYNEEIGRLT